MKLMSIKSIKEADMCRWKWMPWQESIQEI